MTKEEYLSQINYFKTSMPYTKDEYAKKTWGHAVHSLCSYQGKLKPAVAHWLVRLFSVPGDRVLDPLGGVGTVALEACLQGRIGISNDISILAATVAKAKISFPNITDVYAELERMSAEAEQIQLSEEDYCSAEFGLNAAVKDYFHEKTLTEILQYKKILKLNGDTSDVKSYIAANLLHILHGNRPYALSRTSHALTPFAPKGEFVYKNVTEKIRERLHKCEAFRFEDDIVHGTSYWGSYEDLSIEPVNVIITSPPFVGMRFDRPNWMRLWLCGWDEKDFLETSKRSLDRQQAKNWDVYLPFFQKCSELLVDNGILILHLGSSPKYDMVSKLNERAKQFFEIVDVVYEDVSNNEKHGVKDKGTTNKHVFVFLKKLQE